MQWNARECLLVKYGNLMGFICEWMSGEVIIKQSTLHWEGYLEARISEVFCWNQVI